MLWINIISTMICIVLVEAIVILIRILIASFDITPGETVEVSNDLLHEFGVFLVLHHDEEGHMELWWGRIKRK